MDNIRCIFRTDSVGEEYVAEISAALEKYTEIKSRNEYPKMWAYTDKLNASHKERKTAQSYSKIWSIICIALGAVLFVPGLMNPREMAAPLIIGAAGMLIGILRLRQGSKAKNNSAFDKSARKLREDIEGRENLNLRVVFGDHMEIQDAGGEASEKISYDSIDFIAETKSMYLIVFNEKVLPLLKDHMEKGTAQEFDSFMEDNSGTIYKVESIDSII